MNSIEKLKTYGDLIHLLLKYGDPSILAGSGLSIPELKESIKREESKTKNHAERFTEDLEKLGPTYIKLGQLLATRDGLLPKEFINSLKKLQDDVAPVPFSKIEEIIEEQFGQPIKNIYAEFSVEPMATASLGQVHKARLKNGTTVAVKVLRPGVRKVVNTDLESLTKVFHFLIEKSEKVRRFNIINILEEFRVTISRELDYLREAQALETIKENLAEFDNIIIPKVYKSYCRSKVLTMEFIEGTKLSNLSSFKLTEINGHLLVESLYKAYMKQVFVDGIFHSDPHFGNIFYMKNEKLAVIDLGMVTTLSPTLQKTLLQLLIEISEGKAESGAQITASIAREINGIENQREEFLNGIANLIKENHHEAPSTVNFGSVLVQF